MSTPAIDTAREALTAAEAEVDRLRARLRAELTDQDARGISAEGRSATAEDGVAAARARYPKGRGTDDAPDAARDEAEEVTASGAAAGREEARRRAARRS